MLVLVVMVNNYYNNINNAAKAGMSRSSFACEPLSSEVRILKH